MKKHFIDSIQNSVSGHESSLPGDVNKSKLMDQRLASTKFMIVCHRVQNLLHSFAGDSTLLSSISFNNPVSVTQLGINRKPYSTRLV